jgi:hypothetical protein
MARLALKFLPIKSLSKRAKVRPSYKPYLTSSFHRKAGPKCCQPSYETPNVAGRI